MTLNYRKFHTIGIGYFLPWIDDRLDRLLGNAHLIWLELESEILGDPCCSKEEIWVSLCKEFKQTYYIIFITFGVINMPRVLGR